MAQATAPLLDSTARGPDAADAEAAIAEVATLMQALGGAPIAGEPPV